MGPLKPLFYGSVYLAKGGALKSAPVAATEVPSGIEKARDALARRSRKAELLETEPHVEDDTPKVDEPIRMPSTSEVRDLVSEVPDRETNEHLQLEQESSEVPLKSSIVEPPAPIEDFPSPKATGSQSATTLITAEPNTEKVDPSIPRLVLSRPKDPPTAFDSGKESPGQEENPPARVRSHHAYRW
ncbi:hypothetical protein CYMTET_31732 [Cymbomonas tetramitiformis]|uniref:Uncharacterized protein n=1 Tax=Cymbomonas tetramitiformis TaxID=36881 RepID=A0AAE0KSL2_9CHLO|nr:hypothetical protein CYMTET_31732 [Cymbomonas tetramitiformis]